MSLVENGQKVIECVHLYTNFANCPVIRVWQAFQSMTRRVTGLILYAIRQEGVSGSSNRRTCTITKMLEGTSMTAQVAYWGFPIQHALHAEAQDTIQQIRTAERAGGGLNERAADIILRVTEAGLESYYRQPASIVPMSSGMRKTADAGIKVVMGAIGLVIRQFFKNRSHDDLKILVDYVEPMLWVHPQQEQPHLVFTLELHRHQRAVELIAEVRSNAERSAYIDEVIEMLCEVVGLAVRAYYHSPSEHIRLGGLTRKATDMGIGQAEKGIRSLINHLIRELPHPHLV